LYLLVTLWLAMVDANALSKCKNLKYTTPWTLICMVNIFYDWAISPNEEMIKKHMDIYESHCWTFYILNEMKWKWFLCFLGKKYAHMLLEALDFMAIPTLRILHYKVSTLNVMKVLYKCGKGIKQHHDFTKKPFYIYDVHHGLELRTLPGSYHNISTHQIPCT
jgi:hypothetical protein